jgi:hypothetical protein
MIDKSLARLFINTNHDREHEEVIPCFVGCSPWSG